MASWVIIASTDTKIHFTLMNIGTKYRLNSPTFPNSQLWKIIRGKNYNLPF